MASSRALLTDLYQLTMANGYFQQGLAEHETVFHLFYRRNPFGGGYALASGLPLVMEFLQQFRFQDDDLQYLSRLTGNDGRPLFEAPFLRYLQGLRFTCDLHAIPDGTVVFPHEPLLRIQGPIILCQLLETPLLNLINFHTLIATKAARICQATEGEPVLEFGLRRAQGEDGAMAASRAAYVGGVAATSNVLAGKRYGIPVRGTHAHSWVMTFSSEEDAFRAYAEAMPNNCVFLVDTYDTIEGVKKAIAVGKELAEKGHRMVGIRLDSGDLAALSIEARRLLDAAGMEDAAIVASNDLDEYEITQLKAQGARINVWGVGTRLVTAYDQPALGGVYKLSAIRAPGEAWQYRLKLSEQPIKVSNPGILQVRRFFRDGMMAGDMIYNLEDGAPGLRFETFGGASQVFEGTEAQDLLQPVFDRGRLVYLGRDIHQIRAHAQAQLAQLPAPYRRLQAPDTYPTGLSPQLQALKQRLIDRLASD
ncbi:MAG: nicotinate phosphoribosyltransferase [Bacteroidetes bacterium]|nr:MAG: nicotinate phosphoribosyltransferase [Bacteroidota bacterium]